MTTGRGTLRHRLARLEERVGRADTVILLASDWRRLSPEERAALEGNPRIRLLVVETGVPHGQDDELPGQDRDKVLPGPYRGAGLFRRGGRTMTEDDVSSRPA